MFFCSASDSISYQNILLHSTKNLKKYEPPQLYKKEKWKNRNPVYYSLKFISGCSFTFEAYTKNVTQKATKCSLITTEVLLDAAGHVLIYFWYLWRYSRSISLYLSIYLYIRPSILPSRCSINTCSWSCTTLWFTRPSTHNLLILKFSAISLCFTSFLNILTICGPTKE